jgi:outer membrane protein OmpA-like peptidoglycan-associated protein
VKISNAQTEVNFTLHFETAQSVIPDSIMNQLLVSANKWKEYDILLQGHTDNIGTALSNQKLSEERVLEVKAILINQGIDENRIQTKAWVEETF